MADISKSIVPWPTVTYDGSQRIEMFAHLTQLIAAKEMYVLGIGAEEEPDVALPAVGVVTV